MTTTKLEKKCFSQKVMINHKNNHQRVTHKSPESLDYDILGLHIVKGQLKKNRKSSMRESLSQRKTQNKILNRPVKFTTVKTVIGRQMFKEGSLNDLKYGFKGSYQKLREKKKSMPLLEIKSKSPLKRLNEAECISQMNKTLLDRMSCILDQYKLQLCRSQKDRLLLEEQNQKLRHSIKEKQFI